MNAAISNLDTDQVCPYLGLAGDPATHYAQPSGAHRCHAAGWHDAIDATKQARDCLTAQHVACPRYRPPAVPPPDGRVLRGAMAVPASGAGRAVAETGRTGLVRRLPRGRRMAEVILVSVLFLGIAATGMLRLGSRPAAESSSRASDTAAPGAGGSPSFVAAVPVAPPARALPSPTPVPATPSPTPTATPTPTTRPAPTPKLTVYVVRPGDTLTSIAGLYGVTVAAVKVANRLEHPNLIVNPNLIFAGQRIIIPAP